jgi:hypothetical protein
MTQEEKDLLLKDLCARLPYGVKCLYFNHNEKECVGDLISVWPNDKRIFVDKYSFDCSDVLIVVPFLFPMSSMTEEQRLEIEILTNGTIGIDQYSLWDFTGCSELSISTTLKLIQWLYENHFDIYGLIPMGLAIDATGLNIY